ncbi:trypsin-like serine peptidase [Nesterenkonia suensis]
MPLDDLTGSVHDRVSSVVEGVEVPAAEQVQAHTYWTPERMAEARPPVPDVAENRVRSVDDFFAEIHQSLPRTISSASSVSAASSAATSPPVVLAGSRSSQEDPSTVPHVGKVFFSTSAGDQVCSANLVASENRSTVVTAGHCLHEGAGGDFAQNFVFAPAYDDGESEHGLWAARSLSTSSAWAQASDLEHDYAFAVLEVKDGETVEDEVGAASSIAFNQPRGLHYTAYGYPAASPYDGQSLRSCEGQAEDDPGGRSTQGISCDMTGGASGGPWFLTDGGAQNSINSYKYDADPDSIYAPYFGDRAEALYDHASTG